MKRHLYQRWDACTQREKSALALLTILCAFMLVWFGLLSPLISYQQQGREKMNKAAEDYVWMTDNAAQFDYIGEVKNSFSGGSLAQQVTQALAEDNPGLTLGDQRGSCLELTAAGNKPADFLPLMRFLIYLQAAHNIVLEEIDLAGAEENSNLVYINKLIVKRDETCAAHGQVN